MEAVISPLELAIIGIFLLGIIVLIAYLAKRSVRRDSDAEVAEKPEPAPVRPRASGLKVFICYRREDSRDVVGRMYDKLVPKFGQANVFKDIDSIGLGRDFRESVERSVSSCDVFLAVIGKDWLDRTPEGARRIDDSADHVRIEIAAALARPEIQIIPVLVRGASVPKKDDLPGEISELAFRNGAKVRSDPDFHTDVDRLIKGLEQPS